MVSFYFNLFFCWLSSSINSGLGILLIFTLFFKIMNHRSMKTIVWCNYNVIVRYKSLKGHSTTPLHFLEYNTRSNLILSYYIRQPPVLWFLLKIITFLNSNNIQLFVVPSRTQSSTGFSYSRWSSPM